MGDRFVVEVVGGIVKAGAVAIADEDEGVGPRVQHIEKSSPPIVGSVSVFTLALPAMSRAAAIACIGLGRVIESDGVVAVEMDLRLRVVRLAMPSTIWRSRFSARSRISGSTLHVRMQRHVENAKAVLDFLGSNKAVEWVMHPSLESHPDHTLAQKPLPRGAGSIISFGIKGAEAPDENSSKRSS